MKPVERLLDALQRAGKQTRQTNDHWMAQCPAHDDRNPSLSIRESSDGTVLVHCFAGCEAVDVVTALSLRMADLFATEYRYDDGRRVHRTYAGAQKRFHQSGNKAARPSLYRLAKVREAVAAGEVVYLVEGEKDVHALESLGAVATTTPMGAGNLAKADLSPLAEASVVAVVDRDDTGKSWAETVAAVLPTAELVVAAVGKDAADHIAAGHGLDDFARFTNTPTPAERIHSSLAENEPKKSAAALLVDLALERYRFGCTPEGDAFGVPAAGGHVVRMLRGSRTSLRAELARLYRQKTGRIAAQQALADALLVLEGEAQEADPEPVHIRVAEHGGSVWLDLGDATETAVRIDGVGWRVVDQVPVLFRRTALTGQLPAPVAGGTLAELWGLLNVAEADRVLVLGWLVAALGAPDVPHPILAVVGEQGTGKSSASRLLVDLTDPSPVPLRKPPRDMDSWITAAAGSWVVGLDNLSAVPDWLSDTLCRAATGDGDVRRQLYTDSGLAVFAFRRVVLLNGIDLGGLRGDLAERLLTIRLETITEQDRRPERQLAEAWQDAYPRILGALLSEVARMASIIPYVRLGSTPRMADFAMVLAALDQDNTTTGMERYLTQAGELAADSLTSDLFIAAMMADVKEFTGTAAELLDLLTPQDGKRRPSEWPKSARAVTTTLRRNAPALRQAGWTIADLGNRNERHATQWQVARPEKDGNPDSSTSSTTLPDEENEVDEERTRAISGRHCQACRQPMVDLGDGATTHPVCGADR